MGTKKQALLIIIALLCIGLYFIHDYNPNSRTVSGSAFIVTGLVFLLVVFASAKGRLAKERYLISVGILLGCFWGGLILFLLN